MTYISQLTLERFRNFSFLEFNTNNKPVVLTGNNGVGKTTILEALSILLSGSKLRHAPIQTLAQKGSDSFSVTAHIAQENTSYMIQSKWKKNKQRTWLIDGKNQASHTNIQQYLSCLWLTPRLDHFFIDPPEIRRRLIDRIIGQKYPMHIKYLAQYEQACRNRLFLLRKKHPYHHWLDVLEKKITSSGMAITGERIAFLNSLQDLPTLDPFPKINAFFDDSIAQALQTQPASDIEIAWREQLNADREKDAHIGVTGTGPHKSNLKVIHHISDLDARYISTGEQKILLLALLLYSSCWLNKPILLLDELGNHLDQKTLDPFLEILCSLKNQFWITGIQSSIYHTLKRNALFVDIRLKNGRPTLEYI